MIDPRTSTSWTDQELERTLKGPPTEPATFLWVNKHVDSPGVGSSKARGPPASTLQKHVQRHTSEKKRREKQIALGFSSARKLVDKRLRISAEPTESPLSSDDAESAVSSEDDYRLSSFSHSPESCADPLTPSSLAVDGGSQSTLQNSDQSSPVSSNEHKVPQHHGCSDATERSVPVQQLMHDCMHNERSLDVVSIGSRMGCSAMSEDQAMYYMYKATQQLRIYFTSTPNPVIDAHILVDLNMIARFEWYFGNIEAATTHLRFIVRHFNELDPSVLQDAMAANVSSQTDILIATETFDPPLLPTPPRPGRFLPSPNLRPQPAGGDGFASALASGKFGYQLRPIIADILVPHAQHLHLRTNTADIRNWYGIATIHMLHRLLALSSSTSLCPLEETVRIAVIIFLSHMSSQGIHEASKRVSQLNASRLRLACRELGKLLPPDREVQEIYLWVLFTGVSAAGDEVKDANFFASRAAKVANALNLRSYEELRSVMRRFLWVEEKQAQEALRTLAAVVGLEYPGLNE